ncbi:MAG TPA: hypothetical protein VGI19_02060 [Candidatus Cybelea sp.]|jgi:sugar lactone lactonase YvrE
MGRFWFTLRLLASCASIVNLVDCGAGSGPLEPQQNGLGNSVARRLREKPADVSPAYQSSGLLLFVANTANEVEIYPAGKLKKNPKPVATITDAIGCPSSLAMDKQGALYVANECAGVYADYSVTEYPKGQTTHSVTLTDGIDYPAGLAVDKALTLYVSNLRGTPNISEYPSGATSPSRVISGQGLTAPWGLTLDAKQNLYVADYVTDQIFKIPKGTSNVNPLDLQGLKRPIALAFDSLGNLWVADMKGFVNVYPPGKRTPSETLSDGYTTPFAISEDAGGTVIVANWHDPDAVYEYAPGQFSAEATLTKDIRESTGVVIGQP